ncbi:hypothetical protein C2E25_17110 [Geothermobacter hydrogeniphilus]|uniref:Putative Se/S carrier protein-like domain-containing protein n=1 Tax=Geothermobacter hydrogeniphilus TaxID=1969733 RepID=A0A2K2H5D2_9BACT|nr:DUF3343 domain-containing protein [Geothermobacter hydrogeniphilus]PNU18545.1 hypothetical protein C2E25_17110 [Geothermobacter hydrogeniphilus]
MVKKGDLVAIFHSIHRVMKAEKLLKSADADILLIPVPRQLSSDCGLAIRIAAEDRARVLALLDEARLSPVELHKKQEGGFESLS